MDTDSDSDFAVAKYPVTLDLRGGDAASICDAQTAIRREFRDSVKWKKLRCRKVSLLSEADKGSVYVLEVGQTVEFDWTWEGSIAFRPLTLKEFEQGQKNYFDDDTPEVEDSILWSGEILEVDETNDRLFISVSDPEHPPTTGSFYVRPFEFLAFLNAIYNEPAYEGFRSLLPCRLLAAGGNVHPRVEEHVPVGLSHLNNCWRHSWSGLWGPPGTGKTYTTGQQVARCLADPGERFLIVSTTNRATDAAAVEVGDAAKSYCPEVVDRSQIRRIGKGASYQRFRDRGLESLLYGTETEYLAKIEKLLRDVSRSDSIERKALLRKEINDLRKQMRDSALRNFLDKSVRVVLSTAFKATTFLNRPELKELVEARQAPFTTVFLDEAGLISRAAVAVLSLLASRRVVLVGDSKQLAPISRISRILPTNQARWLASSGLSHLDNIGNVPSGIHVLTEQYRMHPEIGAVVSAFQYNHRLKTAEVVVSRDSRLPSMLTGQPRAIWYVLDEETDELPQIRAERGPGNRSWVRAITLKLLNKLLSDPSLRSADGLFISPFRAQAKEVATLLAQKELSSWAASTVHSQQGAQADIVIFDTVNAGSYGWPYDEWKRLVNVALSRSREALIVLASRAEMDEPYLRPLVALLAPRVLSRQGGSVRWKEVEARVSCKSASVTDGLDPNSLGVQLARRKELRPVLSQEQQRLCGLALDGKPRLVRGVAGSGKTVVLGHWLMKTVKSLQGQADCRIWAVYANRSLKNLIADTIVAAWEQEAHGESIPWDNVHLQHVRDLFEKLLPSVGLSMQAYGFEYNDAAEAYLQRVTASGRMAPVLCDALFIDEAQDMGPSTLKLLSQMVRQTDDADVKSRSVNIFYDNAQNVYGRPTPKWSDLGLDMRGRSSVMKESFRSTTPITEFALNVLYRLQPPDENPDHKELVQRGLVEKTERNGNPWWHVRFSQIDGPKPTFRRFATLDQELDAIGKEVLRLTHDEGVNPEDICLLHNGENIEWRLKSQIAPMLRASGLDLSVQKGRLDRGTKGMVRASTSQSFKGYDAEVILIPAIDQFWAENKGILANNLYVAMTRARSMLLMYAHQRNHRFCKQICSAIEVCLDDLCERPVIDHHISRHDDIVDLVERIGEEHRDWLFGLLDRYPVAQEPLLSAVGELIAEPLFWVKSGESRYACFGKETPKVRTQERLELHGIKVLKLGHEV
jgi:superfamily I DNA/RNA helicase